MSEVLFWSRSNQRVLSVLLVVFWLLTGTVWLARGGHRGKLIELDDAPPLDAVLQVDVNRADWPELALLPGIGETLAKRIIESRATHGPFATADDLNRVRGIGPKTVDRLREYLAFRPIGSDQRDETADDHSE